MCVPNPESLSVFAYGTDGVLHKLHSVTGALSRQQLHISNVMAR